MIYLRSTSGQPKLLYAPPEPSLSNYILIYQNPVQPIYTQIFNKNPRLILSLIDFSLRSAIIFPHMQILNKYPRLIWSLIDLSLRFAVNLPHTQILNKSPWLIWSLVDLSLRSAVNLLHTQIFNKNPHLIWSLIDIPSRSMSDFPHTQIINKNPRVICSLIDLLLRFAVNLFTCQESLIDLVTHTSFIKICGQLVHTQILNKNLQLS